MPSTGCGEESETAAPAVGPSRGRRLGVSLLSCTHVPQGGRPPPLGRFLQRIQTEREPGRTTGLPRPALPISEITGQYT